MSDGEDWWVVGRTGGWWGGLVGGGEDWWVVGRTGGWWGGLVGGGEDWWMVGRTGRVGMYDPDKKYCGLVR